MSQPGIMNAVEPDFGDILELPSDCEVLGDKDGECEDGLVMGSGVLHGKYKKLGLNRFERVVLLSNGNLQATVSAWMGCKVVVKVLKNEVARENPDGSILVDRMVELHTNGVLFCTAQSAVHVHDPSIHHLITSGTTGLGQLFRLLHTLPTFTLLAAGRTPSSGLWRLYDLITPYVSTRILETFPPEGLNLPLCVEEE
eukprot:TRINITY_DN42739_c0_g1_i1.p1 TRINITY_DN42739_c0_g1~~TRINITY_DN42739_c0_g1_i1.p1  ORF type:complete len:212 (+),score=45.84 TRINITY_DN42739_c0_g1_i1:44-637(+)